MFEPFSWVYVFTILVIIITYWIVRRKTYWSRKNVQGPDNWFPFHEVLSMFKTSTHEGQYENYVKYGKIWGGYTGFKRILFVGKPELIKKILVKDFSTFHDTLFFQSNHDVESKFLTQLQGNEWKRVRTIIATTFTTQKLKSVFQLMIQCNKIGLSKLQELSEKSQKFDPKTFWGQYVIDIIAKCCFATQLNTYESEDNIFITHSKAAFELQLLRFIGLQLIPEPLIRYMKTPITKPDTMEFFSQLINQILENREQNSSYKINDYLQLLVDAQSDELMDKKDAQNHLDNNNFPRGKLTKNEVIANSIIFLLAGYETTSTLLSFTCYELAKNDQIQEKLFNEVNQVDIDDYQQLNELPILDAILKEVLRLYPPLSLVARQLFKKYQLTDSIVLDGGTTVQIPVYSIHRDADNFDNPNTFDPERFLPPRIDQIKPYTYLPFGGGPRMCVGMRFAQLNAKLALATLIKSFKIYMINETPNVINFEKKSFFLMAKPYFVGISSRLS